MKCKEKDLLQRLLLFWDLFASMNSYQLGTKHLYQENKETTAKLIESYEARIKEKDEQIMFLKKLLENKNP